MLANITAKLGHGSAMIARTTPEKSLRMKIQISIVALPCSHLTDGLSLRDLES